MIAKVSLYLDKRFTTKDGKCHLKIAIRRNGKSAYLLTGIYLNPEHWVGDKVIDDPNARLLNTLILKKRESIDRAFLEMNAAGLFYHKSAAEIADLIRKSIDPEYAEECKKVETEKIARTNGIMARFNCYMDNPNLTEGTKSLYKWTVKMICAFCKEQGEDQDKLLLDNIDVHWIESFQDFCLRTEKRNSAAIHLRNIRAIFNAAIDDNITTHYPFRKFRIQSEETVDKSFSAEELRTLFNYPCYSGNQQEAVDIFMLMFCLIGINCIDLVNLQDNGKGKITYYRAKTHKLYNFTIQPEAQEIIDKYKGEKHLLNILERYPNYKTYFNRLAKTLRKVGLIRIPGKKNEGAAILPNICTGSARTSWATIAQQELDIPREIIAAALGHHTVDVTSTYLRTNWMKKIDNANRQVLDWVLYKKKQ